MSCGKEATPRSVIDHQQRRHYPDQHHRLEGFDRIVCCWRLQDRAEYLRSETGEQDRPAVGCGMRHLFGGDRAAGAAAIVDNHIGIELGPKPLARMRAS